MSDFWAVLCDLYAFVRETLLGKSVSTTGAMSLSAPVSPRLLPKQESFVALPQAVKKEEPILPAFGMSTAGYVIEPVIKVFSRPVWAFDTVVDELTYGTHIGIIGYQGRFVQITFARGEGWVLKDEVTTVAKDVWPELTSGTVYLAADTETTLVRALIGDAFFAAELYLPLRAEEFVTYRLKKDGRHISWGKERPRTAGFWHELLKGKSGIFMSLEPKTGSVMEAYKADGEAFLAFVTAVQPDNTIHIESVGKNEEGMYVSEVLEKSVWQAWRPVFIRVT